MTEQAVSRPKPGQCGASARIQIGAMSYIGPCVLRHGHDGPVHQDADGVQWTDPRPATAEDSAGLCPASLRDQIAEALPCPVCPAPPGEPCVRAREDNQQPHMSRRLRADAVMPVVQTALAEVERQRDEALAAVADEQQRADDRRTELLEERDEALNALADAERERDEALEALAYGAETLRHAEQAERELPPVEHVRGANAEDCPACAGRRDLPYPFICPGTDTTKRRPR